MNTKRSLFVLLTALALTSTVRAEEQPVATLGGDGELYVLRQGTYGQLFPGGKDTVPQAQVLALDVIRPDQPLVRSLVPETKGVDAESSPSLIYVDASESVYLVWERKHNQIHPILFLASYDGREWSDVIDVLGDSSLAAKTSPQLAITRDSYEVETPDGARSLTRTVMHLSWWEEGAAGWEVLYAPIILLDGEYVGSHSLYSLSDIAGASGPAAVAAPELPRSLRLQAGSDGQTVVVGFMGPETGRLETLEIEALPGELSSLADNARSHIIEIGRNLYPDKLATLADKARSHIIEIGGRGRFHPGAVSYLAEQARATIQTIGSKPGTPLQTVADGARSHIIEIGATLRGNRMSRMTGAARSHIIEIGHRSEVPGSSDLFRIGAVSRRTAPETGTDAVTIYLSESGERSLVSWKQDDKIYYRETVGEGWSNPHSLTLGPELDAAKAREILAGRVRHR